MRKLIPLLVVYVILQRGENHRIEKAVLPDGKADAVLQSGILKDDISATYVIVDKLVFDSTRSEVPVQDISKQEELKDFASDAKNTGKTTNERLEALIKAVLP